MKLVHKLAIATILFSSTVLAEGTPAIFGQPVVLVPVISPLEHGGNATSEISGDTLGGPIGDGNPGISQKSKLSVGPVSAGISDNNSPIPTDRPSVMASPSDGADKPADGAINFGRYETSDVSPQAAPSASVPITTGPNMGLPNMGLPTTTVPQMPNPITAGPTGVSGAMSPGGMGQGAMGRH